MGRLEGKWASRRVEVGSAMVWDGSILEDWDRGANRAEGRHSIGNPRLQQSPLFSRGSTNWGLFGGSGSFGGSGRTQADQPWFRKPSPARPRDDLHHLRLAIIPLQAFPYIGCKISLLSKHGIRYEGTLYTIDPNDSTIALSNGTPLSEPWFACSGPLLA